jgi:ribonuclease HI
MKILYTDGGCSGNETKDVSKRRMVMVVTDESGLVLSERSSDGGSNNIAELEAIRDALLWAESNGESEIEVRSDSKNNQAWVFGKIGQKLNDRDRVLKLRFEIEASRRSVLLRLTWIPRASNLAGQYIEKKYGL